MKYLPHILLSLSLLLSAEGRSTDELWQAIVQAEAALPTPDGDHEAYADQLRQNLKEQNRLLQEFTRGHTHDPRIYEAHLRLAVVVSQQAMMTGQPAGLETARQILDNLEAHPRAPARFRTDAAFQKVALTMRRARQNPQGMRSEIENSIRDFQSRYPDDRRVAGLLAELAYLYHGEPTRMKELLQEAKELAVDEQLVQRIDDDLRRVNLLGRAPGFTFEFLNGATAELSDYKGRVVALIFWAGWSLPSVMQLEQATQALADFDPDQVAVLTVNLDQDRADAVAVLNELELTWPTHFDGKSWDSPGIRDLGINALPTVWVLDQQGRLRTLNARDDPGGVVRLLLVE